jgi:hypothetical protein
MIRHVLKKHPYKLALAWAGIIFFLCATPGRYIPTATWLEWISFDKWVHASVFFLLVTLCIAGVFANGHPLYLIYVLGCLALMYGGFLEIMQSTVFSQRSGDWPDFTANAFGCVMAVVFYKKTVRLIFKD